MANYLKPDARMSRQEQRQQRYREKYKSLRPEWDDSTMMLSRFFGDYAASGAVVLDAGCGRSNYVLESNLKRISSIIGVDASREAVAGNTLVKEIVISDLESLPFESGSFDAVVSLWVLEHVKEPEKVFKEVSRVLKPGGRLFFVTPYSFSYILIAKRIFGASLTRLALAKLYGRTEADTFHTDYMANTPEDLRRLAKGAGLCEITLVENGDSSYAAFNEPMFRLAMLVERVTRLLKSRIATMHLVGVFEKE